MYHSKLTQDCRPYCRMYHSRHRTAGLTAECITADTGLQALLQNVSQQTQDCRPYCRMYHSRHRTAGLTAECITTDTGLQALLQNVSQLIQDTGLAAECHS